jgi:hypothetical protein
MASNFHDAPVQHKQHQAVAGGAFLSVSAPLDAPALPLPVAAP